MNQVSKNGNVYQGRWEITVFMREAVPGTLETARCVASCDVAGYQERFGGLDLREKTDEKQKFHEEANQRYPEAPVVSF